MAQITEEAVKKKLDKLKKLSEKKKYLAKVLASIKVEEEVKEKKPKEAPEDEELKKEIEGLKTPEIVKGDPVAEFELEYDSFGEALEPIYYWILDFLKDKNFGMGYEVSKAEDYFAASEASAFYGDLSMRRSAMEKRATELLGMINAVVKSIINLVYDLREFDLRLDHYDQVKSSDLEERTAANSALETIWLTEVDMQKGPASINEMVRNLNFIMLRDAFTALVIPKGKDVKEITKKALELVNDMDIPDQTKRILKSRVKEYILWRELSGKEIKKRYNLEKAYLKSQVNALKLYTRWVKPYLVATNKLLPPDIKPSARAEMVVPFNVAYTYLEIFAKKKVDKMKGKELQIPKEDDVPHSCVEVALSFRASPAMLEGKQFVQRGKATIIFKSYVLSKKDLDDLENAKTDEIMQFVDVMTAETLKAMEDDLKEYTEKKKEEKPKKKKKKFEIPFKEEFEQVKEGYKKVREGAKKVGKVMGKVTEGPVKSQQKWNLLRLEKSANEKAEKDCKKLYSTYKRSHGMVAN